MQRVSRSAPSASGAQFRDLPGHNVGNGPLIWRNALSQPAKAITIYVDADACPVKAEIYRVAERYALKVYVVSNSPIAIPRTPLIERVVVGSDPDAADDWIAERVSRGDIVITADVPLQHRCIKAGADVITPTGRALTEASIGMALATRNLMDDLRSAGQITGGPKPFQQRDRSQFLSALDLAIVRLKRDGFGA
jgi:uncharacterized protein YaiI (UPF0178 family)